MNYFEVFNLPVAYKVDKQKLTEVYLQKQKGVRDGSVLLQVNEAYSVLKDDIRRGEYFLKLKSMPVESISPQFAKEMFTMRENYENLRDLQSRVDFQMNLKKKMKRMISSLSSYENDLKKFAELFCVVRFINSFLEKVGLNAYSGN